MTKAPNILIVDDDNLIAVMLKDTLVENGYTTYVAQNGPEGLDILRKEKIDLVLVDWVMPKMNGLEVCKIIKGNPETKLISVIMVSSQADVQDVKTALDAGVDDYIVSVEKVDPPRKCHSERSEESHKINELRDPSLRDKGAFFQQKLYKKTGRGDAGPCTLVCIRAPF